MYNNFLQQFIGIKDDKTFKATANTQIRFPLKLRAVKQIDSKASFGVQIDDLLVGGMAEYTLAHLGIKEKNDYNQNVISSYGNENLLYLFPSVDFEKSKMSRADSQAAGLIDFLAQKIS